MNFLGDGEPLSDDGFAEARDLLGVDAATLWALLTVETAGFGFLPSRRPVILFERHVFHRLTGGKYDQSHMTISDPMAGGYVGGATEYFRLNTAATLDEDAALSSASWGVGQVMGLHFAALGHASVQAMVKAMVHSEDDQLQAAVHFIVDEGMEAALRDQDWKAFATWYNGAASARNQYDQKLASAYQRLTQSLPDLDVRAVQAALLYLGFSPGAVDGVVGPRTRAAVVAFQRKRRLPVTGAFNDPICDLLLEAAFGLRD